MAVKIDRHGQAAILSHPEIELLFAEGLQSDRDRALFGVCLYTTARIAEACSMLTEDVYASGGRVRASVNIRKTRFHELEPELPSRLLIQSPENPKSHVVDAD